MTWKEWMLSELMSKGMFEEQSKTVAASVMAANAVADMQSRWNNKVEDYPPIMKVLIWLTVKKEALKFIDQNCPQAWFREMFV